MAALVLASLFGAFAGYSAYSVEAGNQFHGGVLDEDKLKAMWTLVSAAAVGFAEASVLGFFVVGIVPFSLWRLLSGKVR